MAMSLETPEKIRNLQRKLNCKAKAEPAFRFYLLYDKICREDVLLHAYALARSNAGAPGVDGTTFEQIDAAGVEAGLAGLREELVSKTYRVDPVRRVMIPKPGGDGECVIGMFRDATTGQAPAPSNRQIGIPMTRALAARFSVMKDDGVSARPRGRPSLTRRPWRGRK